MAACIVIADDLTGANATGVLLTKLQYRATTVMQPDHCGPELLYKYDCLLYPTDSRGVDAAEAYRRVFTAAQTFKNDDVLLYGKRIDSTLRGNLGSETDAMLDSLGEDYIAVAVPCFPSSGRIVVGNCLLVNGVPVHLTDIAGDPKCPVRISEVDTLFRQQSRYTVASLRLKDMIDGYNALAQKIRSLNRRGVRIFTMDCISQEDLDLIADACIASGKKIVAVDPGPFTAALMRRMLSPRRESREKQILLVIGSVNPSTTAQLEEFWRTQKSVNAFVKTRLLLEKDSCEQEIQRVVSAVLQTANHNIVSSVVGDGVYPENRIDFLPYMEKDHCTLEEVTGRINRAFAEITLRILRAEPSFGGLYASGGDVTQAICAASGAAGLDLRDEVLPLAAYGRFTGGELDGIDFVTKGGSQGDKQALIRCVDYLQEKMKAYPGT